MLPKVTLYLIELGGVEIFIFGVLYPIFILFLVPLNFGSKCYYYFSKRDLKKTCADLKLFFRNLKLTIWRANSKCGVYVN